MSEEQLKQEVTEDEKSKSLVDLLSAAFCKSVTVNVRGVKCFLEQPEKQDVLNIQLDTATKFGEARKFIANPEKLKKLSKEEKQKILDQTDEIRDQQTLKLIRLCCKRVEAPNDEEIKSLDEIDDEFLQMVVFQTGGDASPLAVTAKKLSGLYDNDFIQDDPFFRRSTI